MSTTATSSREVARRRLSEREWFAAHVEEMSVALVLLVLVVFFSNFATAFLTSGNVLNLLRQLAPLLVVAVAMTLVVTTAGIDLSVGSIAGLSGALAAELLSKGFTSAPTIALMLAVGAALGVVNGWFAAYAALPPFIVTLAALTAVRGVALAITQGESIEIRPDSFFVSLGQGEIAGIPVPVIIAVPVVCLGWLVLTRTRYGGYVTGIGSNVEAVRRAGIDTRRVILSVYVLSGIAAAVAGILLAARLGSGSSNAAVGFELNVIAAVVLGGTNLFGGRGTMIGTVLGALTIGVIGNGLILMHVSPFYVQIVQGGVLLAAIFVNTKIMGRFTRVRRT